MIVYGGKVQAKQAEEELKASIVPTDPIEGLEASNVQEALEALLRKIPNPVSLDMSNIEYVPIT